MQIRNFLRLAVVAAVALVCVLATPTHAISGPITESNTYYFVSLWSKVYPVKYLWSGDNMCKWEGISCDTAKKQVTILLPKVGLKGTIPAFGNQKGFNPASVSVVSINLAYNDKLTGTFPAHYGQLTQLQELYLTSTSLSGTVPQAWNNLANLVIVDVSSTLACSGLPAWDAKSMPNLQYLHFSNNSLMRGSVPASLATFGAVSFNASGTQLCGCLPSAYSSSLYMLIQLRQDAPQVAADTCAVNNQCTASGLACNAKTPSAASAPVLALSSLAAVLVSLAVSLVL